MSIRIRANATADQVDERHIHKMPPEWARFNQARRIVQLESKAARLAFIANLRLVETPEYVIDLEKEVRRQWPLRSEPQKIPPELMNIMQQTEWASNGNA